MARPCLLPFPAASLADRLLGWHPRLKFPLSVPKQPRLMQAVVDFVVVEDVEEVDVVEVKVVVVVDLVCFCGCCCCGGCGRCSCSGLG